MALPYYKIWTQASGEAPLYLTTIDEAELQVKSSSLNDYQLWYAVEQFAPAQGAPGLLLINKGSSLAIDAPDDNSQVVLADPDAVQRGTWNFVANNTVFQLAASTGQNLCVDQSVPIGDGSRVFTWNWGGGGATYLWNFSFVGFSQ